MCECDEGGREGVVRNGTSQMSHPNGYPDGECRKWREDGENADEEDLDLNGIPIPQEKENWVFSVYSMKEYFLPL